MAPADRSRTTRRRPAAFARAGAIALALLTGAAWAQQDAPAPVEPTADASAVRDPAPEEATLRSRLEALRESPPEDAGQASLDEAIANLEAALESTSAAASDEAQARALDESAEQAPTQIESIKAELEAANPDLAPDLPESPSSEEAEQARASAEAQLESARQRVTDLEEEATARKARTDAIPSERVAAQTRLENLEEMLSDLAAPDPNDPEPIELETRRLRLLSERDAVEKRLARLDAELSSYRARTELLTLRQRRADRRVERTQELVAAAQAEVAAARQREADAAEAEAERLREAADQRARETPALAAVLDENAAIAGELTGDDGINERLQRVNARLVEVRSLAGELHDRARSVRKRVAVAGLSGAVGVVLRSELERLPEADRTRRRSLASRSEIASCEMRELELKDRADELPGIDAGVRAIVGTVDDPDPSVAETVAALAREAIGQRDSNLATLIDRYESYTDRLGELQIAEEAYIRLAEDYREYINQQILWVRSIPPGDAVAFSDVTDWLAIAFSPERWRRVLGTIVSDTRSRPGPFVLVALAAVALIVTRPWWPRVLRRSSEEARSYRNDSIAPTIRAVGATVAMCLPVPVLLWGFGWLLSISTTPDEFILGLGAAMRRSGVLVLEGLLLLRLLRPGGLGDAHFRWRRAAMACVRRHLRWFVPAVIPIVFVADTARLGPPDDASQTIARAGFIIASVMLSVFTALIMRPRGPLMGPIFERTRGAISERTRYLWIGLLVSVPLFNASLAAAGFFYSAVQLSRRVISTLWIFLLLLMLHALLRRWLFLARRRLAVQQARRARLAAADAERSDAQGAPAHEDEIDIPALDQQTRHLIRLGIGAAGVIALYTVWSSMLPALAFFDRVELWPALRVAPVVEQAEAAIAATAEVAAPAPEPDPAPDGESQAQPGVPAVGPTPMPLPTAVDADPVRGPPRTEPLTLGDIIGALVIFVVTLLAGRNVPGLLEILLLQRLPLDAGARFAVSTITRYTIFLLGISLTLNVIGLDWSKIQWLAAALTFGLAFGLQEIFANFVSGLIMLAERPVRVGDTVTVGDVSGTVTRIQMRATTIQDWDRKELIVPNKAFITDRVINWSLSDPTLRVTIPVGVAYGSDTRLVERRLREIADRCEYVLKDPKPIIMFAGFGADSLNFELRVYLPNMDNSLRARSELHMMIDEQFREDGVTIAFPQRDVHIDGIGPIEVRLARPDRGTPEAPAPGA